MYYMFTSDACSVDAAIYIVFIACVLAKDHGKHKNILIKNEEQYFDL